MQQALRMRASFFLLALGALASSHAAEPIALFGPAFAHTPVTTFRAMADDVPPQSDAQICLWKASHTRVPAITMRGGKFWLMTEFTPPQAQPEWTVTHANTWFQQGAIYVSGDDVTQREFVTPAMPGTAG